ncbi:septum site-determining protein MinC [Desulfovibrio inopinatus]|uniref:septum site-determining protein MinC n=1 Tax=Desulfovibrio inopinatus TaxID=102109 RepID=UPI0003F5CA30|nr:septum site-determining protein MinC [Desulfovibrio inopinatus]
MEPFEIKGKMSPITIFRVHSPDLQCIEDFFGQNFAVLPEYFKKTPMVIDVSPLGSASTTLNVAGLVDFLRKHGLTLAGFQGAVDTRPYLQQGLVPWSDAKKRPEDSQTKQRKRGNEQTPQPFEPAQILTQPVRSGQQYYARHADLIVMSSVSEGAEVLADGHIHIYGALRGRAMAGVSGNTAARIFCTSFDAELVAVAGCYNVREDFDEDIIKMAVVVSLDDDILTFTRI